MIILVRGELQLPKIYLFDKLKMIQFKKHAIIFFEKEEY